MNMHKSLRKVQTVSVNQKSISKESKTFWFLAIKTQHIYSILFLDGLNHLIASQLANYYFLLFLVEVSCPGCLLGGIATVLLTGLSSNPVFLACLLGWTLLSGTVSETKTWDVLVCLILPLHGSERTIFWLFPASYFGPEMTKFSLVDRAFPSISPERTELCCKKEACIIGMSGLLGLTWERFLIRCPPVALTSVS